MKYLIDTNICIYIMNKRPIAVIHKFKQFDVDEICVSTITVSELQYGVSRSRDRRLNKQRVEEFLSPFEISAYDEPAANIYGDIRHQLEKSGETIGLLDLTRLSHFETDWKSFIYFYAIKLIVYREALFSDDLQFVDIIEENISE